MTYQKIYQKIYPKQFFASHQKVLVAVSGGIDSMNLLHFLNTYREEFSISLAIAHVNHKQRLESDTEEIYLKQWASENDIPIFLGQYSGKFSEARARNFRYQFFEKIMLENDYTALVTAHHKEDQVETILMRLIRGSRLRHLTAIKERNYFANGEIIRPFLEFKKSDFPDIFHFEDSSNTSSSYFRNRIRNHYLPLLKTENPKIDEALLSLGDESYIYQQAFKNLTANISVTDVPLFLKQTHAVQYLLLQEYLENFSDLQVSKNQFQEILYLIQTKSQLDYVINHQYQLKKDYHNLRIEKLQPKTDSLAAEKVLKYGMVADYNSYHFSFKEKETEMIPLVSKSPIILRHRKAGDSIFFGTFSKKIRRLFIDDKLSISERENAIIGEQDGHIIFIKTKNKTYLRKYLENDTIMARLYIEKIDKE